MDSPRAAEAIRILQGFGHEDAERLIALEERRKTLHRQRQAVQREIKNDSRKSQRLLEKARGLSDDSLLQVIVNRASKAQAKAKANAKAKASATTAAGTGAINVTRLFAFALHLLWLASDQELLSVTGAPNGD